MASNENKKSFSPASEFVYNDHYFSVITIISYPENIYPGFLADLTKINGIKIAIKHIPVTFDTLKTLVIEEVNELKGKYQAERDVNIQEEIKSTYEGKLETLDILTNHNARVFNFQMHIIVTADSLDDLNEKKDYVNSRLASSSLYGISLMFEQQQALMSSIPIFPAQDIEKRIGMPIPSETIAGMYPFTFDCLKDVGNGALIGEDFSNGIILFNQFLYQIAQEPKRDNANVLILGMKNTGKTMLAKLLLKNHLRNGVKCICIDPDGENAHILSQMTQEITEFGNKDNNILINPLEIINDVDSDEVAQGLNYTAYARTINHLKAFAIYLQPTLDAETINMFGTIIEETYTRFNITKDTNFSNLYPNSFPTFDDVNATVRAKLVAMTQATKEREILEKIDNFLKPLLGEYRSLFTGHTNIESEENIMSFSTRYIASDNVKKALLFNALRYSWQYCIKDANNSVIVIEKADLLLDRTNAFGIDFILQILRRSKKYNNGVILVSQDINAFNRPELANYGKQIMDNIPYIFAMANKKKNIETLSTLIELNESERENINYLNNGEAFFICGTRKMNIRIVLTPEELELFETIS